MTYGKRIIALALIDSLIVVFSLYFSLFILFPESDIFTSAIIVSSITLFISHHLFAHRYHLYQRAWEYASVGELLAIFKAVTFSIGTVALAQFVLMDNIFTRALVITWMMHLLLIGGSRFSWRLYRDTYMKNKSKKNRTLIIGAGAAGTMVVRQLQQNQEAELRPVAFIDDDLKKHHLDILGIPVVGSIDQIEDAVIRYRVENIVIAIPSLTRDKINTIFDECKKTNAKTKIIPRLEDIMLGKVSVSQFRDVQVEDLLGRDPVELDTKNIAEYIKGKTILVTGAGGSIGSELCRQLSRYAPKQMILLGHGENSIYTIEQELLNTYPQKIEYITEIADVKDAPKMQSLMDKHRPSVVFHAAAHKHVPLMERNPEEAVKNNIIGTKNVAEAAHGANVEGFVMISTDKAVNPTSVMGATKRIAEMVVQHMDSISRTRFVAVRFGNVLGSRGSVIPLFKKQIETGGPVKVTHPDMERYFMTIPEASRLVIQAGALAQGGEIFVLDMGEPVKIVDLAKNLIKLSGYTEEEIEIQFMGIRPGEKLYEELLDQDEVHEEQVYPKIYVGKANGEDIHVVELLLEEIHKMEQDHLRKELLNIAHGHRVDRDLVSLVK